MSRIGRGNCRLIDKPDLAQLPFYLIEHRQLLPKIPDTTFNNEHTPTAFAVDAALVALTQPGTTGKVARGQLIDLVIIDGKSRLYVRRLLIIATKGDTLVFSTDNSQQLLHNLDRLQSAWAGGNLRWCNSNVWLQDMTYRLDYAASSLQPSDKGQRLLASSIQSPYPAMVAVNDVIVLRPAALKLSMPRSGDKQSEAEDTEWQLKATVKAIDPLAGTLLIEKLPDITASFPAEENSYLYQWAFSDPTYATTDRFSFMLSVVMNRRLLTNQNTQSDKLAAWIQEAIMAELPAHLSLITHWLDEPSFRSFGTTYQRWQNNGTPLGDDAFTILHMLSLGRLPVNQLDIGLMRIATEAQRTAATGGDGSRWNSNVILENQLFYVPQNVSVTP
ncbi:hypothetical protein BTJ39_12475 [Izhakiella australiensis]|uniref:Uncharacterized protein n=1 Tax=Izhakiella australiensis TaxID=1926881 RepID=A0A1S8YL63_9GAMM|nr:hypothetical protein [Izhakiella australiensis]OON39839.1 hypothetical protein BTJ39_12475 [Izhakiella australiensis]